MKANMLITPVSNINEETNCVVDTTKMAIKVFDWNVDITIFNMKYNRIETIKAKDVSLFDHRLIFNNETHKIIKMLSKEELG